ncbi:H-NS family nucleoid-associated regulatory protein [Xanthomonas cannabis]|uniref:H-NS family nucleoid-associated regulatory protein n=1 Tax=Xanthomonas cannabis TaxID=1885674 RepID=UPI00068EBEBE|nr:H-NS family nucleoid-associated regulatory protein [Xanthomonas cannabis]
MALSYAEIQKKEKELRDALAKLEVDKEKVLAAEATKHFDDIHGKLTEFFAHFTDEQKSQLKAFFPVEKARKGRGPNKPKTEKSGKSQVVAKYQLPTGETWSGRGRTPISFVEWKKANPDHEFPAFPHQQ